VYCTLELLLENVTTILVVNLLQRYVSNNRKEIQIQIETPKVSGSQKTYVDTFMNNV